MIQYKLTHLHKKISQDSWPLTK